MARKNWLIPNEVLIPILKSMQKAVGHCADNFDTAHFEELRRKCGDRYENVSLDDIRKQAINVRKSGKLKES